MSYDGHAGYRQLVECEFQARPPSLVVSVSSEGSYRLILDSKSVLPQMETGRCRTAEASAPRRLPIFQWSHTHINIFPMYVHVYIHTHACTCIYIYTCMYIYICTYIIYTYTYSYSIIYDLQTIRVASTSARSFGREPFALAGTHRASKASQ